MPPFLPPLPPDVAERFDERASFQQLKKNIIYTMGKDVWEYIEEFLSTELERARAEERKKSIERLRDAMDTYNSLPENAMQFAFYLKISDMKAFFNALTPEESPEQR